MLCGNFGETWCIFYPFNLILFLGKHNIRVTINEIIEIGIVNAKTYMVVSTSFDAVPLVTSRNLRAQDLQWRHNAKPHALHKSPIASKSLIVRYPPVISKATAIRSGKYPAIVCPNFMVNTVSSVKWTRVIMTYLTLKWHNSRILQKQDLLSSVRLWVGNFGYLAPKLSFWILFSILINSIITVLKVFSSFFSSACRKINHYF